MRATSEYSLHDNDEYIQRISEIMASIYTIQEFTDLADVSFADVIRNTNDNEELYDEINNLRDLRDSLQRLPDIDQRLYMDHYFRQCYSDMLQMIELWEHSIS